MDSVDCVHAVSGVVTCITLQYWALMRSQRCGFVHAFCDFFTSLTRWNYTLAMIQDLVIYKLNTGLEYE